MNAAKTPETATPATAAAAAAAKPAVAAAAKKAYVRVPAIHTNNFKHATEQAKKHGFRVIPVSTLSDNYAYLIVCPESGSIAAVDPAEPDKLAAAMKAEGLALSSITHVLTTHHHWDHSQGNDGMVELLKANNPKVLIVGGAEDPVPAVSMPVTDGQTFPIGTALSVKVIHTPCHTRGHVLYYVTKTAAASSSSSASAAGDAKAAAAASPAALFTGDTLFTGGCGRFFEGTAAEMAANMYDRIAPLPGDTLVWSGHEYSSSNLKFAVHCEPTNAAAAAKHAWALAQDAADDCTQPSSLAEELSYNPFMRVHVPAIQKLVGHTDRVAAMDALRTLKNSFK